MVNVMRNHCLGKEVMVVAPAALRSDGLRDVPGLDSVEVCCF